MRLIAIGLGCLFLAGCANPVNRATSQDYADTCSAAERNGRLDVAEQACYRALVNVDLGNLGDQLKSTRQYDLARIKRRVAKFSEAEALLRESIELATKAGSFTPEAMSRRYIELAMNLAAQGRWTEGFVVLERSFPTLNKFQGKERAFSKEVLEFYADALTKAGQLDAAAKCRAVAQPL